MDTHIRRYFSQVSGDQQGGRYEQVIVLHENPDLTWKELSPLVPALPKGWVELMKLSPEDRVEFTRDYWISQLPYHPENLERISSFFFSIKDIGVVLAKRRATEPLLPHMIYALKGDEGFFHGGHPLQENERLSLYQLFGEQVLPPDYLAFMGIHNGFSKTVDTGIACTATLPEVIARFQQILQNSPPLLTTKGKTVNPHSLLPFYESFGMPFYQCFWKDWYPGSEMGNVYYSSETNTISDPSEKGTEVENMAFPTFLDWLFFYMEKIS